jgi:hypothetical protein
MHTRNTFTAVYRTNHSWRSSDDLQRSSGNLPQLLLLVRVVGPQPELLPAQAVLQRAHAVHSAHADVWLGARREQDLTEGGEDCPGRKSVE